MSDWLNKFHNANETTRRCVYQLSALSSAFARVGNNEVATEINMLAHEIEAARVEQQDAVSDSLSIACDRSGAVLGEVVSAVFSLSASGALDHHAKNRVKKVTA